jgi:hypothetical protein
MKKIFTFIIVLSAGMIAMTSCSKWLEATSSTEIPADKLFETRGGFCDALTGIYIDMGGASQVDEGGYAQDYTWKVIERASYPYMMQSANEYKLWQTHQYNSTYPKLAFGSMWVNHYNCIANINIALRELENNPGAINSKVEYNLFKGELFGLRAYLHFDLLRVFGLGNWDGANASKMTVPYVTSYSKEPTPQKTYAQTAELLMADIDSALVCLKQDPVTGNAPENFETTVNQDGFWNNRTKHLNYYAVEALKARLLQWENKYSDAAAVAQDVIDNSLSKGVVSWVDAEKILTETSDDDKDWIFSTEHLFSLEITGLYGYLYDAFFSANISSSGTRLSQAFVDDSLFVRVDPVTGSVAGAEDLRGPALQLKYSSMGYMVYKFYGSSSYASAYRNRMPLMKISEMYYIIAENYIHQGNNKAALAELDMVRKHRAINDEFPSTANAAVELNKEYYREFIGEGQLFYWLKHTDAQSSLSPEFDVKASDLIFPYPDDETEYGRNQEL